MKTRSGRKRLAWKWLCQLELRYPHLANRAKALNARDKFVMKYDPLVMQMRQAAEESREQKRQWHKRGEKDAENAQQQSKEGHEENKEGEEKEADFKGVAASQRPKASKPLYIASTAPRMSYLDRSWKRSRITEAKPTATASRPVSPP